MTSDLHEPLEAPAVRETVEELYGRIEARFPKRGLLGVCLLYTSDAADE